MTLHRRSSVALFLNSWQRWCSQVAVGLLPRKGKLDLLVGSSPFLPQGLMMGVSISILTKDKMLICNSASEMISKDWGLYCVHFLLSAAAQYFCEIQSELTTKRNNCILSCPSNINLLWRLVAKWRLSTSISVSIFVLISPHDLETGCEWAITQLIRFQKCFLKASFGFTCRLWNQV